MKTIKKGDLQLSVNKFLDIEIHNDGQKIKGKNKELDRQLIYVCFFLGERLGEDEFFIFTHGWLQDHIYKNYEGRKPPLNIKSFHFALKKNVTSRHRDRWNLIEKKLDI